MNQPQVPPTVSASPARVRGIAGSARGWKCRVTRTRWPLGSVLLPLPSREGRTRACHLCIQPLVGPVRYHRDRRAVLRRRGRRRRPVAVAAAALPAVCIHHQGPVRHPSGALDVAAPGPGRSAVADQGRPAAAVLPGARGHHPGRAVRPARFPVHPGLRGPGGLVGDHHGQDRAGPAGPRRLGHHRADHRTGGSRPARPGPAAAPVPGGGGRGQLAEGTFLPDVGVQPRNREVLWGREGKDAATLDHFFDDLGADRAQVIQAVSMDMSPAFRKSVSTHAGQAVICYDPFHVVALSTAALDKVRRQVWQELRKLPDQDIPRRFRGARWALMKNPSDLTDDQAGTLRKIRRRGGDLWRAYTLKEALRAVFAGDLTEADVGILLDRFCAKASRSRLKPFVTLARTIRKRRAGILAAIRLGITNARHEGLNRRVRLIVNRAYGFHSANAALGLIMLTLGPINHVLPHERTTPADP